MEKARPLQCSCARDSRATSMLSFPRSPTALPTPAWHPFASTTRASARVRASRAGSIPSREPKTPATHLRRLRPTMPSIPRDSVCTGTAMEARSQSASRPSKSVPALSCRCRGRATVPRCSGRTVRLGIGSLCGSDSKRSGLRWRQPARPPKSHWMKSRPSAPPSLPLTTSSKPRAGRAACSPRPSTGYPTSI